MTIDEPCMLGVHSASARCAGVKLLMGLVCVSVPLLCCAQQVVSQATQSSDDTLTGAPAERSSVPELDIASIESRIAALRPSRPVAGGTRFATVSLIGYDIDASIGPDGSPRVVAGEKYTLVPYFEVKKPGDLEFDLVIRLGDMYICRQRIQVSEARSGEVVKRELSVRIPLTASVGEMPLYFSVLDADPPSYAGGGTVEVEDHRVTLVTPIHRPSAECFGQGNMIPNPSFEDVSKRYDWVPDEEVRKHVFGYSQVIDSCEAYEGMHSLMVDFHGGIDVSAWVLKGLVIPVKPGRRYEFGFYYRTDGLSAVPEGFHGPAIQITDALDGQMSLGLFDLALPTAPAEWTKHQRIVTIPQGTNSIRVLVRRYGCMDSTNEWDKPVLTYVAGGTIWADCMWLVPAG